MEGRWGFLIVREIDEMDAEKFVELTRIVESTSDYMLWEAGERENNPDKQRQMIDAVKSKDNATILVAEQDSELVGYLVAMGGNARRNKHSAYLIVGILEAYRGQGVGTKLFTELEKWAQKNSIHRLELTVATLNKAGLSLYKKMGFEIEGTKRHSLLIDEEFIDEYYMAKIF